MKCKKITIYFLMICKKKKQPNILFNIKNKGNKTSFPDSEAEIKI